MNVIESLQSVYVFLIRARACNRYVVAGVRPVRRMGAFTEEAGADVHTSGVRLSEAEQNREVS